jgi:A/G-specific adenine glycosylase
MNKEDFFASKLLCWAQTHQEIFPWRLTSDPYKILISELLLRKTTRSQVCKIFNSFFREYPNLKSLASASEASIKRVIKPLGMEHKRATALKRVAQVLLENYRGEIPADRSELMELPNVGLYTANAVLIFAYNVSEPLLDTNIIRVVARVFSLVSKKKRLRDDPAMWKRIEEMMPMENAKGFFWAILDFAYSICLPKNPKCQTCFLLEMCNYGKKLVLSA